VTRRKALLIIGDSAALSKVSGSDSPYRVQTRSITSGEYDCWQRNDSWFVVRKSRLGWYNGNPEIQAEKKFMVVTGRKYRWSNIEAISARARIEKLKNKWIRKVR
jgi:hypothetical protein